MRKDSDFVRRRASLCAGLMIAVGAVLFVTESAHSGEFLLQQRQSDGSHLLVRVNAAPPQPPAQPIISSRSFDADISDINSIVSRAAVELGAVSKGHQTTQGTVFEVNTTASGNCDCGNLAVAQSNVPWTIKLAPKEARFTIRVSSVGRAKTDVTISFSGVQTWLLPFSPSSSYADTVNKNVRCISTGTFEKFVFLGLLQALDQLRLEQKAAEGERKRAAEEEERRRKAEERRLEEEQRLLAEKAASTSAEFAEAIALADAKKDKEALFRLDDTMKAHPSPLPQELEAAGKYKEAVTTLFKRLGQKALADLSKSKGNPSKWIELFNRYVEVPPLIEERFTAAPRVWTSETEESRAHGRVKKPKFFAPKKAKLIAVVTVYFAVLKEIADASAGAPKKSKDEPAPPVPPEPISLFWQRLAVWFPEARAAYSEAIESQRPNLEKMKEKALAATAKKLQGEFAAKSATCANLINGLMAVRKRDEACDRSECSAQTLGRIKDDSDRMNEQLNETVQRLQEILDDQSITEDAAKKMRSQATRSGCVRL